jgi:hypothetical protein
MNKGLSIDQVSGALRIRSSILEALENCDFNHMPLKGYSRNMVSSYARYVGLDSTELTEQFLREYHEFERLQDRAQAAGSYTFGDTLSQGASASKQHASTKRETISISQRNKANRSYWNTEDPDALNRSTSTEPHSRHAHRRSEKQRRIPQHSTVGNTHYSNHRSHQGFFSSLLAHPVMLIVLLVVVLLAILIGWAFLANSCAKANPDVLPITGASVSSGQDSAQATNPDMLTSPEDVQAKIEEEGKYGPFELTVVLSEGASWLQITIDGNTEVADTCNGPWEQTFTVYTIAQVQAGAPGAVKVLRNGLELAFDSSSGVGYLEQKVEEKPIEDTGFGDPDNPAADNGEGATLPDPAVPNAQVGA